MIWWEDAPLGLVTQLGAYTFTEAEMIRFSKAYDPQPFHIDPEAAKSSFYGGLIASGAPLIPCIKSCWDGGGPPLLQPLPDCRC